MQEATEATSPPGWGNDSLTNFLEDAHSNQWATFHRKKPFVEKLIALDKQFVAASTPEWMNPQHIVAVQLFIRSHAAFRTAAGLAMAGQVCEAMVVSRSMLEFAAYAAHIHLNPALVETWLRRHDSAATERAQRDTFSHDKVLKAIKSANQHAGSRFHDLYRSTIDFGAHPNERAVTGNLKKQQEGNTIRFLAALMHGDGTQLDYGLKTVARCGLSCLEMAQIAFDARFELLGINATMLELRTGL